MFISRLSFMSAFTAAALIAGGPAYSQQGQTPTPKGPELRLPGLPPIQLPPGTRVFGPNGGKSDTNQDKAKRADSPSSKPSTGAEKSSTAKPGPSKSYRRAIKRTKPIGRKAQLNDLFNRLGKAQNNRQARGIVRSIERTWLQSGSDTADLLMRRALLAMKKKKHKLALRLLDQVVYLEPAWPEVWNKRATVRYFADDPDGAVTDIAQTLSREPRHFKALVGLGFILRQAKQDKLALQVFRHALKINPRLSNINKIIEKLTVAVEGQGI